MSAAPRAPLQIRYVANVRLPSERANSYQIFAQCDAFRALGAEVTVVAPRRRNTFGLGDAEVARHYGLRAAPSIVRLATLDLIDRVPTRLQRLPFVLQSATFAFAVRRHLARARGAVVYSRDPWSLALLARGSAPPLFFEAHDLPVRAAARRRLAAALQRAHGVVAITRGLAEDVLALGVPEARILVAPDGYDPARFRDLPEQGAARRSLGLDPARPLAVYTGHLFPWKGADVLVEAAARSRAFDAVLVGGRPADRARVAARIAALGARNVRLLEPVEPLAVPPYLAAADVLVLPNSATERISARYTSPLKLFEYLAVGRAIVASDLPSLREVLEDGGNAVLVQPDDAAALAAGVERCLRDRELAARIAARAAADAQRYTWDARAESILEFVRRRLAEDR